ncbi:hypothetical protein LTR37_017554 [Vermiconidia calcicola]|uniref:Uncharacterized protein n=1 Tax=Vermiconidia calcicola TaxID=1690605 RepID=A0ACC3MK14_9PEZI|nr:hypothetical protein LTR37_017554 [Vermiconidia calcicola]
MSLALLPSSPMAYSQPTIPTLATPGPTPSKKPRLSLNTFNVAPVFGKGSTSLRLETLSATSPTARNTFRNAQDIERRTKRPNVTPLATNTIAGCTESITSPREGLSKLEDKSDTSTKSSSCASTTSTTDSLHSGVPYKLTFAATSILINGPISRERCRTTSFSQSRPMFPTSKKVAFRAPLTEDIKTSKFTMRHSDIESSSSTISTLELSPSDDNTDGNESVLEEQAQKADQEGHTLGSAQSGDKGESPDKEDDGDKCPATPVAGRRMKHRQWRWTLGPISTDEHVETSSTIQEKPATQSAST